MSDSKDTKQCPNCKHDILSDNFTIHFVHCQRNFYLCSKCEQPVNYNKTEEHNEANHVSVHCTSCQLKLEKCHLNDHLDNDCPNRKVKCQICDIEVGAADITEHEDYCGSRTEKCSECGEFVMFKYKSLHVESNHAFIKLSDEPGPSPSWQHGKRTLCNFLPDLTSKNYKPANIRKRRSSESLRRPRTAESSESMDELELLSRRNLEFFFSDESNVQTESKGAEGGATSVRRSTRKDLDEWPMLSSLRSLQISEEKQENSVRPKSSNSTQNNVNEDSDLFYAIQVSHEINSEIWEKENNIEEEVLKNCFKPLSGTELSAEKSVEKNMFENNVKKAAEQPKMEFKNDFNYLYDKHECVKLPCEFCGNLIVSNDLILHQSRCSLLRPTDSYTRRGVSYKMPYFDEDVEKKVACGICNKFYRLSLLENHQLHCHRNISRATKHQNFSKNLKAVNMKSEPGLQNGLEPSSPQLTRVGTRSEWLSELSKNSQGGQHVKNNLNHPESGVISRTTKVSRKSRRAPSPPGR